MIIKEYNRPKLGDKKFKECFALLPIRIQDGAYIKIIWLQKYYNVYEYSHSYIHRNTFVWLYKGKSLNK